MRFVLMCQLFLLMLTSARPMPQPYTAWASGATNPQTVASLEQAQEDETSYPFAWQVFLLDTQKTLDTCAVLLEDYRQQKIFLAAYQNPQLLEHARKLGVGWSDYFEAVRNMSVKIYISAELESVAAVASEEQISSYFVPTSYTPSDPYPMVVMETRANATIWGLDIRGNHVQLVNRSGLLSELAEEQVLKAYQTQYGLIAGKVIFYAHLYHEMKHLNQLYHDPSLVKNMTLEQYQQNEVEAYKVSLQIVGEAIATHGCL